MSIMSAQNAPLENTPSSQAPNQAAAPVAPPPGAPTQAILTSKRVRNASYKALASFCDDYDDYPAPRKKKKKNVKPKASATAGKNDGQDASYIHGGQPAGFAPNSGEKDPDCSVDTTETTRKTRTITITTTVEKTTRQQDSSGKEVVSKGKPRHDVELQVTREITHTRARACTYIPVLIPIPTMTNMQCRWRFVLLRVKIRKAPSQQELARSLPIGPPKKTND